MYTDWAELEWKRQKNLAGTWHTFGFEKRRKSRLIITADIGLLFYLLLILECRIQTWTLCWDTCYAKRKLEVAQRHLSFTESIEWFIEDQVSSLSYDLAPFPTPPLPLPSASCISLSLPVCRWSSFTYGREGGGRGGVKTYYGEKAFSSTDHSILSVSFSEWKCVYWSISRQ